MPILPCLLQLSLLYRPRFRNLPKNSRTFQVFQLASNLSESKFFKLSKVLEILRGCKNFLPLWRSMPWHFGLSLVLISLRSSSAVGSGTGCCYRYWAYKQLSHLGIHLYQSKPHWHSQIVISWINRNDQYSAVY